MRVTTSPLSFAARTASSRQLVRLYQLAAAAAAALLLHVMFVPSIIDHIPRWIGAAVTHRAISGNIVYLDIANSRDFNAVSIAQRQADAVRIASQAGAEAIFLEGRFIESDAGIADLRRATADSKVPITIGWPLTYGGQADSNGVRIDRRASFPGVAETVQANRVLLTKFRPTDQTYLSVADRQYRTFPAAIAGIDGERGEYRIDYRFNVGDVPIVMLDDLSNGGKARWRALSGKRVVIGATVGSANGLFESLALTPNRLSLVPRTLVDIVSAETLRAGPPVYVHYLIVFGTSLLILYFAIMMPTKLRRRIYALGAVTIVTVPLLASVFGPVIDFGLSVALMIVYFTLRWRSHQRERAASTERMSGLPNFHALEDDFPLASGRLVVAKIDKFEPILASLESTHHAAFVQQIARRLAVGGSTRIYTDATGHFAWFEDLENARSHVAGLLALTSAPIVIDGRQLDFSCSFGLLDLSLGKPRQAISATVVAADLAATRPTHIAYVSEQEGYDANWQLSLLASLDHAIANEQIYLVYQVQRTLADNAIVGVEALVRWRHPERGVISPSQFIPQIEQAGRLKPLTAHTLRLAAKAANRLSRPDIRISVNISATAIADDDFVSFVDENITGCGCSAERITIEITETARIPSIERAARNLTALQRLGYHIALDDFGTGEANLSLLVALPCDELKIDRSFVVLAEHSERARMIIAALASTTRSTGMRIVAEGIESERDRDLIMQLGCDIGQGFQLGKPQPLAAFLRNVAAEAEPPSEKLTLY